MQISGRRLGCGLRAAGCGLRAAGCGLRAAGCGLRAAGCGLPIGYRWLAAVLACACLLSPIGHRAAGSGANDWRGSRADPPDDKPLYDPDSILVRFDREQLEKLDPLIYDLTLGLVGGELAKAYTIVPGLELIRLNKGELKVGVEDAIERLKILPYVKYAEPNYYIEPLATPNDTQFGSQWGLHNTGQTINTVVGTADADIDAPEAWDFITSAPDVPIAIIDSGVAHEHPDLDDNLWINTGELNSMGLPLPNGIDDDSNGYIDDINGLDLVDGAYPPWDPAEAEQHGTAVAGIVGAEGNNSAYTAGVLWDCKLVVFRITTELTQSEAMMSDVVAALEYCADHEIRVSNNSYRIPDITSTDAIALEDAIAASQALGHIFVAGAGNSGGNNDSTPVFPASYGLDNVISVAATNNTDALATFAIGSSNYGAVTVDLGAPGWSILAPSYDDSTETYSTWFVEGTSFATPHVAAACAMLYQQHPTWTIAEVKGRILGTTRWLPALEGKTVSGGILDLGAAVSNVLNPPTNLQASVSGGTVALTWTDNSSDEAGFTCQRIKLTSGVWGSLTTITKAANSTSHSDTPGTGTFRYRLRAGKSTGVSNWTVWVQVSL